MRILGIDPGSSVTGFGVVERTAGRVLHVAHGSLRPAGPGGLPARLHRLREGVEALVAEHRPDVAAVEQVFVAASPRAALVLGQARGAALAALGAAQLPVNEYAASRIKQAVTGSGRAGKEQVQAMVRRLLALERLPGRDAADALAAAICHAHAERLGVLGVRGRTRRRPARGLRVAVRRGR